MMATASEMSPMQRLRFVGRRVPARMGTFSYVGHRGSDDDLLELVRQRSTWTPTCVVWNGALTKDGYPAVYIDGRLHRLWRLLAGLPKGHTARVYSTCGRRDCVNIEHLGVAEKDADVDS